MLKKMSDGPSVSPSNPPPQAEYQIPQWVVTLVAFLNSDEPGDGPDDLPPGFKYLLRQLTFQVGGVTTGIDPLNLGNQVSATSQSVQTLRRPCFPKFWNWCESRVGAGGEATISQVQGLSNFTVNPLLTDAVFMFCDATQEYSLLFEIDIDLTSVAVSAFLRAFVIGISSTTMNINASIENTSMQMSLQVPVTIPIDAQNNKYYFASTADWANANASINLNIGSIIFSTRWYTPFDLYSYLFANLFTTVFIKYISGEFSYLLNQKLTPQILNFLKTQPILTIPVALNPKDLINSCPQLVQYTPADFDADWVPYLGALSPYSPTQTITWAGRFAHDLDGTRVEGLPPTDCATNPDCLENINFIRSTRLVGKDPELGDNQNLFISDENEFVTQSDVLTTITPEKKKDSTFWTFFAIGILGLLLSGFIVYRGFRKLIISERLI
jgi:hypothetical protein